MEHKCPLCNGSDCYQNSESQSNSIVYDCKSFHRKVKIDSSIEDMADETIKRRLFNLVCEDALRQSEFTTEDDIVWRYSSISEDKRSDDIPMAYKFLTVKNHPVAFKDKVDRILLNLSYAYPGYMHRFAKDSMERLLFAETKNEEQNLGILELLVELGYLICEDNGYHISAKGWSRIDLLQHGSESANYGFVAMKFGDETNEIREAIRKGIEDAGYQCIIMDELEHNNQIVPEIFHRIDNCRFLVMDATVANLGAYYEAGYALGKGKEVIICCRKKEFDSKEERPHFDIAQKSTILWNDENELPNKLKERIGATVTKK